MHIHSRCTHFQTPNHSSNQVCLDMVLECHKKSSQRSYHSSQSQEVAPRGLMACSRCSAGEGDEAEEENEGSVEEAHPGGWLLATGLAS